MRIIIDISKTEYDILKILNENGMGSSSDRRILNGIPLTEIVEEEQEPCNKCVYSTKDGYCQYDDIIETIPPFKSCKDAISRDAVIKQTYLWSKDEFLRITNPFDYLRKRIKSLPPVNPQEKTGHWIRWYEQKENDWVVENIPHCKCSECNQEYDPHSSQFIKYCNECGAKMIKPQERNDKK